MDPIFAPSANFSWVCLRSFLRLLSIITHELVGDTDTVLFPSYRYHATCLKCAECLKPLAGTLDDVKLVRKADKHFFYCYKDYDSCGFFPDPEVCI